MKTLVGCEYTLIFNSYLKPSKYIKGSIQIVILFSLKKLEREKERENALFIYPNLY